ncbi:MAG: hypothetical protein IKZ23_03835, partial [Clostridia bacterium]|nr:hypothetical protein [Clostridia bacterium]
DTIQLFQKYEQRELDVALEHIAEFEVYKHVIPLYRQHFFRKNSTKYKPTIEKLPDFISYASTVLDILFKHNVFIDNEDDVFYNENGDIDSALEEIKKTSTS